MIVVFAGNRPDETGRTPPRFPAGNVDWVGHRLERLLVALRPTAVVGAAAAGADLLLLGAAARHQIPSHVVLPFEPETFCKTSVADRGAGWAQRFERLLAELPAERLLVGDGDPDDDDVYLRANAHILDAAGRLAGDEVVLAVVVRSKVNDAAGTVTDDFVARAEARGMLVIELDPRLKRADMKSAFVVMPYGVKTDRSGNQIDCEATFAKIVVPAMESVDLDWTRADRQTDAGIIHVGMLERLAHADTVIVDVATENANAFYELGARHVLRPRATVLIGPDGIQLPFNVNMLRRVGYRLTGSAVGDADAVDALRRLRPVLEPSGAGSASADSPVYQLFEIAAPSVTARGNKSSPAVELHRRIEQANDIGQLIVVADAIAESDLAGAQRSELILRVAVKLRERRQYGEAIRRLETLDIPQDQSLLYGWWCQQLALALRRLGEELLERGDNPDELWDRAEQRLSEAMQLLGDDPETCGIAGGLVKRRALRLLRAAETQTQRIRAQAFLDRAIGYYHRGFDQQPADFYTAVNLVTLGRLRAAQGAPPKNLDLDMVAAVAGFYSGRAGGDFWSAATVAELVLDEHLSAPGPASAERVVAAYAAALAVPHPADYIGPVRDQLDLIRLSGVDRDGTIAAVLAMPDLRRV
jgi:hypothetical protein